MISAAQLERDNGISVVTSAFKKALNRSCIRPDDNFFDLGGNPWSAMALFSELSEVLGRELSPLLIFHAPTALLLNELLQEKPNFTLPSVTLLKSGDPARRPLFLFHGSGSTVMELFELAKFIQTAGPVFGMQAPGTDGLRSPFQTIEEIAGYHMEAMKNLGTSCQPLLLIGYSAGGLVALEVARQIKNAGGEVGLLVLIDAFLPLSTLSQNQLFRLRIRRKSHRIAASTKRKTKALLASERSMPRGIPIPETNAMRRFQEVDRAALNRYRGHSYPGQVKFIQAKSAWTFPLNPVKIWSPFIQDLTVETSPGDHTSLLSTYYRPLGSLLSRYILEILGN